MLPNDLGPVDVRVLGALIEKELSTPDHYPLSLNALTNACNQSSNREPVMALDESAVADAITRLRRQSLVRSFQSSGSRVPKYQHLLEEEGIELSVPERAVLCVMMLRGPQTLAEVRTRGSRLTAAEDTAGLESALNHLAERQPALVARLPRRPGQKEVRYAHLLSGEVQYDTPDAPDSSPPPATDRLATLEEGMAELRAEIADLRGQLEQFRKQFE